MNTKNSGGLQVDDQLQFVGLLDHRHLGRIEPFQDLTGVHADVVIGVPEIGSVADETAGRDKLAEEVHGRQRMVLGQRNDAISTCEEEWVGGHDECPGSGARGLAGGSEIVVIVSLDNEQRKP